ncbi:MAG TPA: hypothetical protein VNV66_07150 [Pilimelia sp.]|nr:hypothetical protein [Pilimelia sp.]
MAPGPRHPVDRDVLPYLMIGTFAAGTVLVALLGQGAEAVDGYALWVLFGAVLSFAAFLAVFGVYLLGWLLREHERWREARRTPEPEDSASS